MLILNNNTCDDSTCSKYIKYDCIVKLNVKYIISKINVKILNGQHVYEVNVFVFDNY